MSNSLPPVKNSPDSTVGAAARREEILAVACDLFFSKGFAAASMRDVANQIGFTQAAIYYHFRSKDDILFALVDDFTKKLKQSLEGSIRATGNAETDLRQTVRAHILVSRTHYREIKLVIEDKKLLAGPFVEQMRVSELEIYNLYKSRFVDLAAGANCNAVAPSVAAFTTLGAINFVYQWYRPGGSMDLEAIADQTVNMLMHGFIAGAGPVRSADKTPPPRRQSASSSHGGRNSP